MDASGQIWGSRSQQLRQDTVSSKFKRFLFARSLAYKIEAKKIAKELQKSNFANFANSNPLTLFTSAADREVLPSAVPLAQVGGFTLHRDLGWIGRSANG